MPPPLWIPMSIIFTAGWRTRPLVKRSSSSRCGQTLPALSLTAGGAATAAQPTPPSPIPPLRWTVMGWPCKCKVVFIPANSSSRASLPLPFPRRLSKAPPPPRPPTTPPTTAIRKTFTPPTGASRICNSKALRHLLPHRRTTTCTTTTQHTTRRPCVVAV